MVEEDTIAAVEAAVPATVDTQYFAVEGTEVAMVEIAAVDLCPMDFDLVVIEIAYYMPPLLKTHTTLTTKHENITNIFFLAIVFLIE